MTLVSTSLQAAPALDGHLVYPFAFDCAVRPFGDGVLQRIAALGHAYADAAVLKLVTRRGKIGQIFVVASRKTEKTEKP